MSEKQHIIIKGVKEGLLFLFDDQCAFSELLDELQHKLEKTHQQVLSGPLIHIHVKLGTRQLDEEQKEQLRAIIRQRGNLLVQSIETDKPSAETLDKRVRHLEMVTGVVRSGQTLECGGDLLLIGDVNPGGTLLCGGDIYVLGALRGMAHAGMAQGELLTDRSAIIAASLMRPTQLRIADIISRPPDEWMSADAAMEFAYLHEGQMQIDKLSQLHRLRKDSIVFKGV